MTIRYQVGVVLDSTQAFDIYHDATGAFPPPMEPGCNTRRISFRLHDENGIERAAMLIHQTGFGQTALEEMRGEEVNGLSLLVATDAPADEGERLLDDYTDHELFHRDNGTEVVSVVKNEDNHGNR